MRLISPRSHRRASLLAAVVPFVFALACGGDHSTNPNDAIDGTYSLKTIDGSPLPLTFQNGTTSITLTKDVLTVASNGSWTESFSYTQTENGQTTTGTDADAGTWSRAGSSVSFYSSVYNETSYTGSYANGTLNVSYGGSAFVFTR